MREDDRNQEQGGKEELGVGRNAGLRSQVSRRDP